MSLCCKSGENMVKSSFVTSCAERLDEVLEANKILLERNRELERENQRLLHEIVAAQQGPARDAKQLRP